MVGERLNLAEGVMNRAEKELKRYFIEREKERFDPELILLFGSRARNEQLRSSSAAVQGFPLPRPDIRSAGALGLRPGR